VPLISNKDVKQVLDTSPPNGSRRIAGLTHFLLMGLRVRRSKCVKANDLKRALLIQRK
jgi:hypothetical protein